MASDEMVERGIRSWAVHNFPAATAVASVDNVRLEYLCGLLKTAGLSDKQADARATLIYWAYIGRVMVGDRLKNIACDEVDSIADLLRSRSRGS